MSVPAVRRIESFVVTLPRDTPYLGPLGPGESVNARGYLVRRGNRTIYPTVDRSVVVKATATDGTVGWGETYGIVAPRVVQELLHDIFVPFVEGRAVDDPSALYQELYDLMRVRGASAGFTGDALAALDIALWDLKARALDVPLVQALGGVRQAAVPAYVSGLPKATLDERVALALEWRDRGFRGVKYAGVVSHEGVAEEMHALRAGLGPASDLMVDLHWRYDAAGAIALAHDVARARPYFIEAPCAPEDIAGLAEVAREAGVPVAAGEEWHNVYEAQQRLDTAPLAYVQPEMAHTGVSQFMAIAAMAHARGAAVIPHATVGVGIFMAASLHASAALAHCPYHEYQHSVFDRNLAFVDTQMRCSSGHYALPAGPGLGVVPKDTLWKHAAGV